MRILIVGGYGTFGGRIVELLERQAALTLIVSGQSLVRAERYCAARGDNVRGVEAGGQAIARSWYLLAEGADGPLIPSMAVEAVVLKNLAGSPPQAGARACVEDIDLEDYEQSFAGRTIYTGERGSASHSAPLYERILGDAWGRLPTQIRTMHRGAPARLQAPRTSNAAITR